MSDFLIGVGIGYAGIALIVAIIAGCTYESTPRLDRRGPARVLFLAPFWPMLAIRWVAIWIRFMWFEADWGSK